MIGAEKYVGTVRCQLPSEEIIRESLTFSMNEYTLFQYTSSQQQPPKTS